METKSTETDQNGFLRQDKSSIMFQLHYMFGFALYVFAVQPLRRMWDL